MTADDVGASDRQRLLEIINAVIDEVEYEGWNVTDPTSFQEYDLPEVVAAAILAAGFGDVAQAEAERDAAKYAAELRDSARAERDQFAADWVAAAARANVAEAERDAALAVIANVTEYLDELDRMESMPATELTRAVLEAERTIIDNMREIVEANK